jgi:carbon starvation protein CstA
VIGIVLLAAVLVLLSVWLAVRASGRTLGEISGDTTTTMQGPVPSLSAP